MNHIIKPKMGDCESCTRTNVELVSMHNGSIEMCIVCLMKEKETVPYTNSVITEAKKIDSEIITKSDVFNAPTISVEQIRESIYGDDSIAPEHKSKTLAAVIAEHIPSLRRAIFEDRVSVKSKEESLSKLETSLKILVGTLEESERAKYQQYNVSYQPIQVKKIKAVVGTSSNPSTKVKFDKTALKEASKQFNLPAHLIQSTVVRRGITLEQFTRELSAKLGQ